MSHPSVEDIKINSRGLRGTLLEGLADPVTGSLSFEDQRLVKFHGTYQQDDRDIRDERRRQKLEPAHQFMIRIRAPGGVFTPEQWLRLDAIATTHANHSLRFLDIDNEQLIAYAKVSDDRINVVVTVVNLDPYNVHSGWLEFDPADFDVEPGHAFQMHDLLSNRRFTWEGGRHFVRLDPASMPAHILRLRRRTRDERDFDYFF